MSSATDKIYYRLASTKIQRTLTKYTSSDHLKKKKNCILNHTHKQGSEVKISKTKLKPGNKN